MTKRHLKRHACPNTWKLKRKAEKYIIKPRPGGHPLRMGKSIGTVLKDLKLCTSTKEVKRALTDETVLVNGTRVSDFKYQVGFMDVISVPTKGIYLRISFDEQGKLNVVETTKTDANLIPCKVRRITLIKNGTPQLNCHNGYNILETKIKPKLGETVLFDVSENKIIDHVTLKTGAQALLVGGSFRGSIAQVGKIEEKVAEIKIGEESHVIPIRNLFLISKKVKVR